MASLITIQRAIQNATLASVNSSNPAYLSSLIASATASIQRYCNRDFIQQAYSEYYTIGPYNREPMRLRQFPVARIQDVAIANRCIQVLNNGGAIQKATVETLANGDLQLVSTASGVVTTNVIPIASNITILAVTNAIGALGNGWSTATFSSAAGSYAGFPSADLKPLTGAMSAMVGGCYIDIYESWYGWNTAAGFWPDEEGSWGTSTPFWRLQEETGEIYGRLPRGQLGCRIRYVAGFATIPQDIQEACVQLTQNLYQQSLNNSSIKEAKLGNSSIVLNSTEWPAGVKMILDQYKDYSKAASFG